LLEQNWFVNLSKSFDNNKALKVKLVMQIFVQNVQI
jgi:hypothetical protein